VLYKYPEPFTNAECVVGVLDSISTGYICSYVFYFLTVHLPFVRNELSNAELIQPLLFLLAHRYSRVINTIDPQLLQNDVTDTVFLETIKVAPWRTKGTLMQTGAFGASIYTKQFPEAIVDMRVTVINRIRWPTS